MANGLVLILIMQALSNMNKGGRPAAFVLVRDIIKNAHGVSIKSAETLAMCKNLELYFERYYRSMLLQSSDDINRCMTHALSHPTDPAFQSLCQHHH